MRSLANLPQQLKDNSFNAKFKYGSGDFYGVEGNEKLKDKAGNIPRGLTTPISGVPGPGHNAWMMISATLVLFMTLPGLGLFYGGLVRTKNALSVMGWCFGITSLVTVLWWAVGYSLVFGKNFNSPFLGGSEFFFFLSNGYRNLDALHSEVLTRLVNPEAKSPHVDYSELKEEISFNLNRG